MHSPIWGLILPIFVVFVLLLAQDPHSPLAGMLFMALFVLGLIFGPVWLMRYFRGRREAKRLRALEVSEVDVMTGQSFETYVARLLEDRGFKRVAVTPATSDYGADIICRKDGRSYAVQVKRSSKSVGRRAVSDAVAARPYYGCTDSMVVTNSVFSSGARILAKSTGCQLIDRDDLADWIRSFQGKVSLP